MMRLCAKTMTPKKPHDAKCACVASEKAQIIAR